MRVAHVDVHRPGTADVNGAPVVVAFDPIVEHGHPLQGAHERVLMTDHRLRRLRQRLQVGFQRRLVVVYQRRKLVGEESDVRERTAEAAALVGDGSQRFRQVRVQIDQIRAPLSKCRNQRRQVDDDRLPSAGKCRADIAAHAS